MLILKRQVQSLIDKGAFTKAIGLAAEYVRRNPDSAAGHQLVAMAEEAAGYTKAAIQTVSHAIDLAPDEPSIRIMRARLLIKDHHLQKAIADIDAIIATSDPRLDAQLLGDAITCRDELLERLSIAVPPAPTFQDSKKASTSPISRVRRIGGRLCQMRRP
jgi:hypothetical protein